jgi:hypothetical protein
MVLLVEGLLYTVKLVEEWGCFLGEDLFLSEEKLKSPFEKNDAVSERLEVHGILDDHGDVEELINDLRQQWSPESQPNISVDEGITVEKNHVIKQLVCKQQPQPSSFAFQKALVFSLIRVV